MRSAGSTVMHPCLLAMTGQEAASPHELIPRETCLTEAMLSIDRRQATP